MPSFGPYELLERLGVGGMGEVFLARLTRQASFEKLLVIKRILPQFSRDVGFREAFCREARLAALLSHQNIVQIFDFGEVEEQSFIAMEFVEGVDVSRLLAERKRLDLSSVVSILQGAARGLDYAHRKRGPDGTELGLVHRDVAPKNLLVSCEGEVKWIDFGLAHVLDETAKSQGIAGTIAYMSPEQASGRTPDARSDLFSLGVTTYEMLTGQLPFGAGVSDLLEHVEAVRAQRYPLPSDLVPELPREVDVVLCRALEPDAARRYQSVPELLTALEALAQPASHEELGEWVRALLPKEHVANGVCPTIVSAEPLAAPSPSSPSIAGAESAQDEAAEADGDGLSDDTTGEAPVGAEAPMGAEAPSVAASNARGGRAWWLWGLAVVLVLGVGVVWVGSLERPDSSAAPPARVEDEPSSPEVVRLSIRSTPPGAAVSLDGSYVGETPLVLHAPPGVGHLEVKKLGYEGYEHRLTAAERERGEFEESVELRAIPTSLTFEVQPPDAQVYVDGVLQSAQTVAVEPGARAIRVALTGYFEHDEQLMIEAGEKRALAVVLRRMPVVLRVEATPEGAGVEVRQGEQVVERCTAPCVLQNLAPGTYELEGAAPHHAKANVRVTLEAGKEATATLVCKPLVDQEKRVRVSAQGGKLTSRDIDGDGRSYLVEHTAGTLKVTIEGHSPEWMVTALSTPYSRLELDSKVYEKIAFVRLKPGRHVIRPVADEMSSVVLKLFLP